MAGTPGLDPISTKLQRIAELARQAPCMAFTNLAHHVDVEFLKEAFHRTRKDGATGVDGQTAQEYAEHLEENLQSLHERLKSGTYRAPPVRRVYIPKGDGKSERPIGIPGFEDKVLQRSAVMILTAIYEQDFRDCSYGFRPGRSAHQAVEAVWKGLMAMDGGWVLELDIRSFFDELDHVWLRAFLDKRVRDGVIRRVIHKWLKAGVMEEGAITVPDAGSPQGGVISPLLANVYLHEVLDVWFEDVVKPRLKGHAFMVRYADDAVLVFREEGDARRVLDVLPKRFEKHGLRLHPEKTRLVDFRRPGQHRPETFDLLGFTHYWGCSRQGQPVVKRKTSRKRFTRALKTIAAWCRKFRHEPVRWQSRELGRKLTGHCAYYGITGNAEALSRFKRFIERIWRTWLSRRSQRGALSWDRFTAILRRFPLPQPRVVHSVYRPAASP
jgi:RNA-directed DNA polymerase